MNRRKFLAMLALAPMLRPAPPLRITGWPTGGSFTLRDGPDCPEIHYDVGEKETTVWTAFTRDGKRILWEIQA